MQTAAPSPSLTKLFSELVDGANDRGGAYVLNTGDIGLLRSLDKLSADAASRSVNDGATIAAHAQHVRYGLSLMNRWAREGGDPFTDAKWDEAWKTSGVDARLMGWKKKRKSAAASLAQSEVVSFASNRSSSGSGVVTSPASETVRISPSPSCR